MLLAATLLLGAGQSFAATTMSLGGNLFAGQALINGDCKLAMQTDSKLGTVLEDDRYLVADDQHSEQLPNTPNRRKPDGA